jgi:hypothetical protein
LNNFKIKQIPNKNAKSEHNFKIQTNLKSEEKNKNSKQFFSKSEQKFKIQTNLDSEQKLESKQI